VIVCVCNAINEEELDDAVQCGCSAVEDVWKHFKCQKRCGICVESIEKKLDTD